MTAVFVMALYVIATPIGVASDISKRAVEVLNRCATVIGEDYKNTSRLLNSCQILGKEIYELNEHSKQGDLPELCELANSGDAALVSDCGTPGFCDPGAALVQLCRKKKIPVYSVPGPSSLMAFLSVCGLRIDQFMFRGFLPAENTERQKELEKLRRATVPIILMDTPYRLKKLLSELNVALPSKRVILATELSTQDESVLEGTAAAVLQQLRKEKAEFVLCLLP